MKTPSLAEARAALEAAPEVVAEEPRPARARGVQPTVEIIAGTAMQPEPIAWLWDGWLALGKVHMLAGAPGAGKTTLAIALGATLTIGGRWPDGTVAQARDVLIWSGEDDPRDTLIPRFLASDGDRAHVHFIDGVRDAEGARTFDPATDTALIENAIGDLRAEGGDVGLLIVDPIVSAVAGDSHKNAEVRRALQPLADLSRNARVAVLGITHFSKGTAGRDPVDRVTGSLAFGAVPRLVLAAAKRSEDQGGGRLLARAKSNIGPDGGGFAFDLAITDLPNFSGIAATRVFWGEQINGTARELLATAEAPEQTGDERSATSEAEEFLREALAAGPVSAKDVIRDAKQIGISDRALRRAKERLKVQSRKQSFAKGWAWGLSPAKALSTNSEDAPKAPKAPQRGKEAPCGAFEEGGRLREQADSTSSGPAEPPPWEVIV